jgi:ribonucleoside-diphosphate reductase alpha chain
MNKKIRPKTLSGETHKVYIGCGSLYITINSDENGPLELFITLGKAGGCPAAQLESTGRLVSMLLQYGAGVEDVVHQLRGIQCPKSFWHEGRLMLSCSDAIAWAMSKERPKIEEVYQEATPPKDMVVPPSPTEVMNIYRNIESPKTPRPEERLKESYQNIKSTEKFGGHALTCPDCGGSMSMAEGCATCMHCGFSECS